MPFFFFVAASLGFVLGTWVRELVGFDCDRCGRHAVLTDVRVAACRRCEEKPPIL